MVVTGGAGLLGREVVRQLAEHGCRDIRVLDLEPEAAAIEGSPSEAGVAGRGLRLAAGPEGGVRTHRLDLRHDDLTAAFAGAATVFHLAACQYHSRLAPTTYRLPFHAVNVEGTRRALEAARRAGVVTFVHASSSMVYGLPRQVPVREDHPRRPLGPYGRSKLHAETLVEEAHAHGLATAIVRPGPIFGPGRVGFVTRLFDLILAGRPITLIGDGSNRQELTAPEDCARLVVLAGRAAGGHAVYNCGAAAVPTMREWLTALVRDAGSGSTIRVAPATPVKAALRLLETVRLAPVRREQYEIADRDYFLDTTAAREKLGWVPRHGGVDAALAMFRWYRAQRDRASRGGP